MKTTIKKQKPAKNKYRKAFNEQFGYPIKVLGNLISELKPKKKK